RAEIFQELQLRAHVARGIAVEARGVAAIVAGVARQEAAIDLGRRAGLAQRRQMQAGGAGGAWGGVRADRRAKTGRATEEIGLLAPIIAAAAIAGRLAGRTDVHRVAAVAAHERIAARVRRAAVVTRRSTASTSASGRTVVTARRQ